MSALFQDKSSERTDYSVSEHAITPEENQGSVVGRVLDHDAGLGDTLVGKPAGSGESSCAGFLVPPPFSGSG